MQGQIFLGLKYAGAVLVWLAGLGLCAWFVLFTFAGHALSLVTALPLVGYESAPVDDMPLLGPLLGDLFPEATYADWMAIVYAGVAAVGAFFVGRLLGAIRNAWRDRLAYLAANDTVSARFKLQELGFELAALATMLVPYAAFIRFDLKLMELRNDAVLHDVSEPGKALLALPPWSGSLPGTSAALQLVHGDALWGYLASMILVGLFIETALDRMLNALQSLFALFGSDAASASAPAQAPASTVEPSPPTFRGYDAAGQPIPLDDTATPLAFDVAGQPVATPPETCTPATANDAASGDDPVSVVGGTPGERVRVTDALAAPDRYYVDPATRQVWSRPYWQQLHDSTTPASQP